MTREHCISKVASDGRGSLEGHATRLCSLHVPEVWRGEQDVLLEYAALRVAMSALRRNFHVCVLFNIASCRDVLQDDRHGQADDRGAGNRGGNPMFFAGMARVTCR